MMNVENLPPNPSPDTVRAIARHLHKGEDVVRCAAARALGAIGDENAAPALVDALLDEDPDVRTDAMAALVHCARPEDADAIRRSLLGDPVKEVKVFAIEALSRLADGASVPLLRGLAKDRCAHDIAWEDDAGMWDDWLDVQVAAITALGKMGVCDAIDDLLEARSDEMGQELDQVVFAALARIPDGGIATLLGLLRDRNAAVRERAFLALSKARRDVLAPLSDLFVQDASPDVRRLAIGILDPDSPMVPHLALNDPDASVRRAALRIFAPSRRDIALAALADEDEEARAIALEAVASDPGPPAAGDLAVNVQAWMDTAGACLAATCATVLPKICGAEARDLLCRTAADTDRPQEVRIAALRSLSGFASDKAIETLRNAATDPARQVRTSALACLAELSKSVHEPLHRAASDVLIGAIRGDLLEAHTKTLSRDPEQEAFSGAARVEDGASRRITISRDGEIVPADDLPHPVRDEGGSGSNLIEGQFPRSTLAAVQAQATTPSGMTNAPNLSDVARQSGSKAGSRRRRVAVDGPDDIGTDLRLIALGVAADCPGRGIEQALAEALDTGKQPLRVAAFGAVAQRSQNISLSPNLVSMLARALADPDPVIRGHASRAVGNCSPNAADQLAELLDDPDAIVRSVALKAAAPSAPDRVLAGLRDTSPLVRSAALEAVLDSGNATELEQAMRICLEENWTDSLAKARKRSAEAHRILLSALSAENLGRRQTQVALEAIAST
jgi:HEAT repeat protein